jgi:predicted nicotinamide N-methyase
MRGDGAPAPPTSILDLVSQTVPVGDEIVSILRPRDWDELRHEEGGEGRSAPYWALVWPSALGLAESLALRGDSLVGLRVLELGCGLGLPSIVAARAGARVLATDGSPDAVVFAAHNMAVNEVVGDVAVADWRSAESLIDGGPWDLVIAADILYVRHNVEALLRVLPRLIGDDGEAVIADPGRAGGREFLASARRMFALATTRDPKHEKVALHTVRHQ